MAHRSLQEPKINTKWAYAYAKTDHLHDMEDFLGMTNVADILVVGEKCFKDELYQAAKLLFTSISNWACLATTLIYRWKSGCCWECQKSRKYTVSHVAFMFTYSMLMPSSQGLETGPHSLYWEEWIPPSEYAITASLVLFRLTCDDRHKYVALT